MSRRKSNLQVGCLIAAGVLTAFPEAVPRAVPLILIVGAILLAIQPKA